MSTTAKIWLPFEDRGEIRLAPAPSARALANDNVAVPGVFKNERSGELTGAAHALAAQLSLVGQFEDASRLLAMDEALKRKVPLDLTTKKIPDYQKEGVFKIVRNIEQGYLLNDDMGLGKTIESIVASRYLDSSAVNLLLCPAPLKTQWKAEIEKWGCQGERVQIIWPQSDRKSKKPMEADPTWVIAFYLDAVRAFEYIQTIKGGDGLRRPFYMYVDEAHNIRGFKTKRMGEAQIIRTYAMGCLLITGSPLMTDIGQIHALFNLAQPRKWGSYGEFVTRYASAEPGEHQPWVLGELSHQSELNFRYRLAALRRERYEIPRDQFPFETFFSTVELDPPTGNTRILKEASLGGGFGSAADWGHERMVAACKTGPVVEAVMGDRRPTVIFTHMTDHADSIGGSIPNSCVLHGKNSTATNRLEKLAAYLGRCQTLGIVPVVVTNYDSLGEGANLQWATQVELAALPYDPEPIDQAIRRVARFGQRNNVNVRIWKARLTTDERKVEITLAKLKTQAAFFGKREQAKVEIEAALSPKIKRDYFKGLYERAVAEELEG